MLCVPPVRALVAQVAVRVPPKPPPTATGCAEQPTIDTPPSLKSTVPVGDEPPVIVAVNVTVWPTFDGLSELASVVVVAGRPPPLTTCESALLVDVRLPASPP
jgi:hypothetical protein